MAQQKTDQDRLHLAPSAARPPRSATTCAIRSSSALDHLGRKLGGLPVEVIYEDDQIKPEVGVQKTQKLIESDKVDFIVGYIWSNVLLASLKPMVDSKTFTDRHQCRRLAARRRAVLALRVLDLLEQRPDAGKRSAST